MRTFYFFILLTLLATNANGQYFNLGSSKEQLEAKIKEEGANALWGKDEKGVDCVVIETGESLRIWYLNKENRCFQFYTEVYSEAGKETILRLAQVSKNNMDYLIAGQTFCDEKQCFQFRAPDSRTYTLLAYLLD